jgi:hypothetical protein
MHSSSLLPIAVHWRLRRPMLTGIEGVHRPLTAVALS